jgi:hypothetical protein
MSATSPKRNGYVAMNDHAPRTSLSEDSDPLPEKQEAGERRWSRDREGGTDVRSRPHMDAEDSEARDASPATRAVDARAARSDVWGAPGTRPGIGSVRSLMIEDEEGGGAVAVARPRGPAKAAPAAPLDVLDTLWLSFERSLGAPLERPERLRIDLPLSSIELTTLRKTLGWLRQIDAVQDAALLVLDPDDPAALRIPVERGRVVLTPPLLAHLYDIARDDEPAPRTLVRWICSLAREQRELPWVLTREPLGAPPPSTPRLSTLELLLACCPERSTIDDPACRFIAQTVGLASETWLFARTPKEPISGLLHVHNPSQRSLLDAHAAALMCSSWLLGSGPLGLLESAQPAWFAACGAGLCFGVAGPAAISLQRAPRHALNDLLAHLHGEPAR